jgi:hypothetical protein
MTTFDKREQGFEARLAHDAELKFRAIARRNKWLGLWAAEKLGKTAAEAENYANSLVAAELQEGGDDTIFFKVRTDFDQAKVAESDHQLRRKMEELLSAAVMEVETGTGKGGSRPLEP